MRRKKKKDHDKEIAAYQQELAAKEEEEKEDWDEEIAAYQQELAAEGWCESIGGVRLAGSRLTREGRVEVYLNGEWGTIMDLNAWGENEARAVCRQLGFDYYEVASFEPGYYGHGTGPVHLGYVRCPEEANSLRDCTYYKVTNLQLNHDFDAAVTCYAEIRLHGSYKAGSMNGVIQIFSDHSWRSLCTSTWTAANSEVVCRWLGYPTASAIKLKSSYTTFYQRDYQCEGNERSLEQCPDSSNTINDCEEHLHFLTCSGDEESTTSSTPQNKTTFTLSTIWGSSIFLMIVIVVLSAYLFSVRKRASRHRRWITLTNGRQQCQPTEMERRRMRRRMARRVRGRNQRREAPNVYSISNGQRGNDRDLPPYSRLEEDTPPPYSQLQLPRIEIPVVGREERYEDHPPRCTETDAIDYFQELDAEQLRLQYENAAVGLSGQQPQQYPEQPPPDYATAANPPVQERPFPDNNQDDVGNSLQTDSIGLDDEVDDEVDDEADDISLSDSRTPIPILPKDTVNINATVTSVEV